MDTDKMAFKLRFIRMKIICLHPYITNATNTNTYTGLLVCLTEKDTNIWEQN